MLEMWVHGSLATSSLWIYVAGPEKQKQKRKLHKSKLIFGVTTK